MLKQDSKETTEMHVKHIKVLTSSTKTEYSSASGDIAALATTSANGDKNLAETPATVTPISPSEVSNRGRSVGPCIPARGLQR